MEHNLVVEDELQLNPWPLPRKASFLHEMIRVRIRRSRRQRHNDGMPIISIGAQQPRLIPPGAVARLEYEAKIMRNPFNKRNRQLMHDNYGIQLPVIERHQQQRTVSDTPVNLSLIHHRS